MVTLVQLAGQLGFDMVRAGFRADPSADAHPLKWAWRYALVTLISGSTWGIAAILWLPGSSFEHHIFFLFVLACLCMATAITRASYLPAAAIYVVTACTPTFVLLLIGGSKLALVTLLLSVIFFLTALGWVKRINTTFRETFKLRLENADLVGRMMRLTAAAEQKRHEAEVAEARARAADKAKGEFLTILGHEIHAPLEGLAEMATRLRKEPLSATQRALTQTIEDSSQLIQRLLDDMVDLSEMEANAVNLRPAVFDPVELTRGVARLARHMAQERGLSLELDLVPGTPPYMIADPDRVRQILLNLISNAVKYTEVGGVMLRVAPVQMTPDATALRFSVTDTGIGLSAEAQTKLFEIFWQERPAGAKLDTASLVQRLQGGIGLGLPICDRLARLMGGRIGVDSVPGQGSTFWVLLPPDPGFDMTPYLSGENTTGSDKEQSREALIDHGRLFELERRLGAANITTHLAPALRRLRDIHRRVEESHASGEMTTLADAAFELQRTATELGLLAVARLAGNIDIAARRGLSDAVMQNMPRLSRKMGTSLEALAHAYPALSSEFAA